MRVGRLRVLGDGGVSIQAVAWVLANSESKGTARLVLIALANRVGREDGECWPSLRLIASDAGVASPSTVHGAVDRLVALGELEVLEVGTQRRSARYRLPFAMTAQCSGDGHSGVRETNAESSPGRTLSPAQAGQNRKEPSGTQERARKRAAPPPIDFTPDDALRAWAEREAPGCDTDRETRAWLDWCAANGRTYRDHRAGWRTWMRRAKSFAGNANGQANGQAVSSVRVVDGVEQRFYTGTGWVAVA